MQRVVVAYTNIPYPTRSRRIERFSIPTRHNPKPWSQTLEQAQDQLAKFFRTAEAEGHVHITIELSYPASQVLDE